MTAVQFKQAYTALPEKQKVTLAAWIRAERLSRDPAYAAELSRRNKAMDAGRKWSLADARGLAAALARHGL